MKLIQRIKAAWRAFKAGTAGPTMHINNLSVPAGGRLMLQPYTTIGTLTMYGGEKDLIVDYRPRPSQPYGNPTNPAPLHREPNPPPAPLPPGA